MDSTNNQMMTFYKKRPMSLLSVDAFLNIFNCHRQSKLSESPKFSLVHLSIMWKINLKRRTFLRNESFNDTNDFPLTQWYLMTLEALYSKIFKPTPLVKNKTFPVKVFAKYFLKTKLLRKNILLTFFIFLTPPLILILPL